MDGRRSECLDSSGRSPFAAWFNRLNVEAAAKVATALTRISLGNLSNVKGVGSGVFEYKIEVTRLPDLLRQRRRDPCHPAGRWNQTAPAARCKLRVGQLAGLQTKAVGDVAVR